MDLPGDDGPDQIGPFSKNSPGGGRSPGNVMGGTGWYRKHFTLDKADEGLTAVLKFDGVYMETEVWVNGQRAGVNKYGYSPFWFDVTRLLNPAGETNVVAVKVDNTGRNTRWYSGSGIYRNVHLVLTNPLHIAVWGVYITTPEIQEDEAVVDISVTARNEGGTAVDAVVKVKVLDKNGKSAGENQGTLQILPDEASIANLQISVEDPDFWSIETPDLYQAVISIETPDQMVDTYNQSFGIRNIEFSAEEGFLLNGESILLKGACMHHDNGLLGSAAFNRAEERRVEIMKANGFNAIRTSHNPPSEAFLDACDRLGMLVIDEFADMWERPKNPQDYSVFFKDWWQKDLKAMLLRDRNHPSIILWSIGNEIPERNDTSGWRIGKQLVDYIKGIDNTRLVTNAINGAARALPETFALLDVCGYNYGWNQYEIHHEDYPDRIMMGTESFPMEAFENWEMVEKHPYVIGDFVWTGLDYLGEVALGRTQYVDPSQRIRRRSGFQPSGGPPSGGQPAGGPPSGAPSGGPPPGGPPAQGTFPGPQPGMSFSRPSNWPWFGAWCGDIDITGEKKSPMIYRDVLWNNSKLEINVHAPEPEGLVESIAGWGWPDEWPIWTWPGSEGDSLEVRVFTKGDRARLELNGKVVGEKNVSAETKYTATFDVPYEPGELKAIAYEDGKEIATKSLKTAGEPERIRLTADRYEINADRNDLSFVKIEVVDDNGQIIPRDSVLIKLTITGNGELAASGNAGPYDMGSFNRPEINTFKGRAQAIIRPFAEKGNITLKAEAEGLEAEELSINVR